MFKTFTDILRQADLKTKKRLSDGLLAPNAKKQKTTKVDLFAQLIEW